MDEEPVTIFWNTILPMLALGGLAVLVPSLVVPRQNLSHPVLTRAVVATGALVLAVGAILAALLYARINEGVFAQILAAPLERAGFFLGRSALFAMLWGPLLAFVWLVQAQELNRKVGMKMVDGEGKL